MRRVILIMLLSLPALGQECSHLWNKNLEINPAGPKAYVGDSWAAYALMGYKNVPNLAWHFVGKFPRGRFMSIETYTTEKKKHYDASFDYEFEPNAGSENPFRPGVMMETPNRDFEVRLIPAEGKSKVPNVIHISTKEETHAVYYRVYVPSNGVTITEADLPKIYAYNVLTGEPMACPQADPEVIFAPDLPQLMVAWVRPKKSITFKSAADSVWAKISSQGNNAAIPYYMFGLNRVKRGNVMVVKFKAPTFFDTASGAGPFQPKGDVRYWSLCTQNLVKGLTLTCAADFMGKPDANGFVYVVVGNDDEVKKHAEKLGYVFIEDRRGSDQPVMQFIYRVLLPNPEFEATDMYKGDYNPRGTAYTREEFLKTTR